MCITERKTMQKQTSDRSSFRTRWMRGLCAAGVGLLIASGLARTAEAQDERLIVSGTVTGQEGAPLTGVTVTATGTDSRAVTGVNGRYSITNVPSNATLSFVVVGRRPVQAQVAGRNTIDVSMERVAY